MAKRIVDEDLRFNVIINGNEAQAQLYQLEKRNRELNEASKALRAEKAKLEAQGKKNTEAYRSLTAELKKNNLEVNQNKSKMLALQKQIGITGLTIRQLKQRASNLRLQLANMVPGSAQFKKLQAELQLVNTQIQKVSLNSRAAESGVSKLANGFNKYFALGASVVAMGTGVVLSLQKMIDYNGKLSDAQSDVQKTTGLTKKEVDELTKSFGILKTRTQRIDLLKIAEEGGRIGIVKDEIQSFVAVMNKANVALGDTFPGGVEEVASKLGKLKFLFKETKDLGVDIAFNSIGSALNDLGANGNATELNIAEFATRVGALPDALKPAISDALALGAAFEESGITAEIGARAYSIILSDATTKTKEFAKVMGISQEEVKELINSNPLEFFLKFTESLKGLDATQTGETLKFLGVSATGAQKAIGAATNNQDRFRELMKLSNKSLIEATSLLTEYEIKNNNLAATIEKVKKSVLGAFTSEAVVDWLTNVVDWFAKFIGATEDADGKVTKFRNRLVALLKAFIIITAAVLSYRTAIQLAALWTGTLNRTTRLYAITQKVTTATTTVLRTATLLFTAAMNLATGNIVRARAAMVLFNRTMMLSPIGLIVAAVGGLVAAYYLFSDASKKAVTSQSQMNDAIKEANIQHAAEIHNLKNLLKVAQDESKSKEERQRAIDQLNKSVPEYNNNLTIESARTLDATEKLDKYITKIKEAAKEKFLKSLVDKKAEELAKAESSSLEENLNWWDKTVIAMKSLGNPAASAINTTTRAVKNQMETVARLNEELRLATENYQRQQNKNADSNNTEDPNAPKEGDIKYVEGIAYVFKNGKWQVKKIFKPPTPTDSSSKVDQAKKEAAALLKLQRETEDNRLAFIEDSFKREMAINDANFKRKFQDLGKQSDEILEAHSKAIESGDTDLADILMKQYNELYDQIEQLDEQHQVKQNDILEKGIQARIDVQLKAFNEEEQQRLIAHNNELAALGTNDVAKKALQDKFDKDKLERQKASQQLLANELKKILETSSFNDFSIELLTDEQLQDIKNRLASLGLSISEINILLAQMKNPGEAVDILGQTPGQLDVLGFSVDQWVQTFDNLDKTKERMQAVVMTATAMLNAYQMFSEFQANNEKRRIQELEKNTNREKDKQQRLLDNKLISQKQYDDAIKSLDDKLEKKKAEIAFRQAKREKAMAMANIAIQTGQAIMSIWAQVPKFDFGVSAGILTGIVSALGAAQLALVASQPLPAKGFESGYYGNSLKVQREQDGKLFNAAYGGESRSGLVDKPTVFMAGEGGKNFPELIVDGRTLKQFDPELKNSLYREISRIRGFENGYYKSSGSEQSTQPNVDVQLLNQTMARTNELLAVLESEGVIAYMSKRPQDIRDLDDEIKKHQKRINKNIR